ncbi:MAG: Rpn family recombination-promoting nuclease/putative transposase [Chloroherpetonaceae bacterium]
MHPTFNSPQADMHTDKLIYLLLQLLPQGFFRLIGRNPDDASRYQFKSVELKETAFRIDGVFIPNSPDDVTYFVEAQFQPDEHFYARLFAEIFLYLKQYPTVKWTAVVIYPSRSAEQKAIEPYAELLALKRVKRIYLDELPQSKLKFKAVALYELLIAREEEAGERARRIAENASVVELDLIEQILSYKFRTLTREEIKKMLKIQEELGLKETAFYREAFEEGEAQGILKGKLEGKLEGKLATVPLLRELGLSDEVIAEKLQVPLSDVQRVAK